MDIAKKTGNKKQRWELIAYGKSVKKKIRVKTSRIMRFNVQKPHQVALG